MPSQTSKVPDSSAERVALWRALHVQCDPPPHILEDTMGLNLIAPDANWQLRPDMHLQGTSPYRAGIVARARFTEDYILEQTQKNLKQYVLLGAGLDTFVQRRMDIATKLQVFEIDKPDMQTWKQQRLKEVGLEIPKNLHFIPVNFEKEESWPQALTNSAFDKNVSTLFVSAGVSMYLTKETNFRTFQQITALCQQCILLMTFILPLDLIPTAEQQQHKMVYERAQAAGTPFISFYYPQELKELAIKAGFSNVQHIPKEVLLQRYFQGRSDNFRPGSGEEFLIAST